MSGNVGTDALAPPVLMAIKLHICVLKTLMVTVPAQIETSTKAPSLPTTGPLVALQFNSWAELDRRRAEWNHILAESPPASIFMTPEWLSSWWRAFGAGRQLCSLAFRNSQGVTVAIAPLYSERDPRAGIGVTTLRFLGAGSGDSDGLDFIVLPGYELAVAQAFADWFQSVNNFHVCALETLPKGSLMARHLQDTARRRKWTLTAEALPHSFVDLPRTWNEYLEALPSDFRPLLTRYPKRLQSRFKVNISRCDRVEELDFQLQTLFTLHQMRWTGRGEPGAFAGRQRRDFYSRMAIAFLQRGWLEFWSLALGDEIVATQFCFRYRDTVSLLQEGFNPAYTSEKVGYALRAHVLQEMIAAGARRYDFLGGADAYKTRFGSSQGSYLNLYFAGPSWKGRLFLAARQHSRAAKRWLKTHLPQPILSALQHRSKSQPANG
jgi:CelD/BcsL family acetyltransferase involved in cellulose biosynthesis